MGHPFAKDVTFSSLMAGLHEGWTIHSTMLTESFTYEEYLHNYQKRAIPLFALTPNGTLKIFTVEKQPVPGPGWTLLSFAAPQETKKLTAKTESGEGG